MNEIDYDRIPEEIERLHAEAEDLADCAKRSDGQRAVALRNRAKAKVREAARLRAQIEEA